MSDRIHVSYFSDILCVWAYVAQIRLGELQKKHRRDIEVTHHFIPLFGNTEHRIDGSPTYLLNQGRQKLYGNVGYKIIEANVEEVLRRPAEAASWC